MTQRRILRDSISPRGFRILGVSSSSLRDLGVTKAPLWMFERLFFAVKAVSSLLSLDEDRSTFQSQTNSSNSTTGTDCFCNALDGVGTFKIDGVAIYSSRDFGNF